MMADNFITDAPEQVWYVTYSEGGGLTGCYYQVPVSEHLGKLIQVTEDVSDGWLYYSANEGRDGVQLTPVMPPAVLVPQKVTRRQARQALLIRGLLDKVQPAIDAISDTPTRGLAQIEWDDSQDFERSRPLLIELGTGIGLDSNGMDELFIFAATL